MEFLEHIVFWHWLVFALVLLVLELLVPGVIFLFLAIGAGVTGLGLLANDTIPFENQLLVFGVSSAVAAMAWRGYLKKRPIATDKPKLNKRAEQYVDRVFEVHEAIVNGRGSIKVDDSTWTVQAGEDIPKGGRVKVTGADGVVLIVEKV